MIITKTPLRISIGGGGTDLPSYYQEYGGFVISAAINKYVYISVNTNFFPGYFLRYSSSETPATLAEIKHPLIKEALLTHGVDEPLEIVSVADVPSGTGLGSSGSFLVGLVHALSAHKRNPVDAEFLARSAVDIEMNRLQEPVGKQDQYIAAYGGLLCQEYCRDGSVNVAPLRMKESSVREFRDSLMLFFVGTTRSASVLLGDQKNKSETGNQEMLNSLHFVKRLGCEIKQALEAGDIEGFGQLMHKHWLKKRERSVGMTNRHIDELYELARTKGGAAGGKLVGAGGSGFLLFNCPDRKRLRRVMCEEAGLTEMDFTFDFDGSAVMLRNRG